MYEILVGNIYFGKRPATKNNNAGTMGPVISSNTRPGVHPEVRTERQERLRKIARFSPCSLVCIACLFMSSCHGSSATMQTASGDPSVEVAETTGDRTMLLQTQPSVSFATGRNSSGPLITVDDAIVYQQMDGFGGSLTDSSAWLIRWHASERCVGQVLSSPHPSLRCATEDGLLHRTLLCVGVSQDLIDPGARLK